MITIGISPVAFSIGGLEVMWYGIMVALAVIAVILIASIEAKRVGVSKEAIYSLALWAIVSGLVVSRLIHIIDQWDYYMAHPRQIIGFEGQTIYGAILGALIAAIIYCRLRKVSFWQLADIVAPGAVVGQAIGRVGCILNGCCYGLPTDSVCAAIYTSPDSYAPVGIPVHPTQFYLLLWNLIVFGVLWSLRKRVKPVGSLFLLYMALYAFGDFIIRFLREGEPFLFGLQQAQVIGLAILLVTVPWFVIRMRRKPVLASDSPEETKQRELGQGD